LSTMLVLRHPAARIIALQTAIPMIRFAFIQRISSSS
jgi:hypothetical protein